MPDGAELVAAHSESDDADAYGNATWQVPDDLARTSDFYSELESDRWSLSAPVATTALGSTLVLDDADGVFDRASVTISSAPSGALIAVRFIPPGGPAPIEAESPSDVIAYGTLPPVEQPDTVDLPAWAVPDDGWLVSATEVGDTVYAEVAIVADPAAVLDTYGRALDDAGIGRRVSSSDDVIVIDLPDSEPAGSIALTRDPDGTRAYFVLP